LSAEFRTVPCQPCCTYRHIYILLVADDTYTWLELIRRWLTRFSVFNAALYREIAIIQHYQNANMTSRPEFAIP
jgi:hypothetical protein